MTETQKMIVSKLITACIVAIAQVLSSVFGA